MKRFSIVVVILMLAIFVAWHYLKNGLRTVHDEMATVGTTIHAYEPDDPFVTPSELDTLKKQMFGFDFDPASHEDAERNLEIILQACKYLESDPLPKDCWSVLDAYFMNELPFTFVFDSSPYEDPYADFNASIAILERDECELVDGPIRPDMGEYCQVDTLRRSSMFLSNCPTGPLNSRVRPLERDRLISDIEYYRDAGNQANLELNYVEYLNEQREYFYRSAWLRLKCKELGDWFGVLFPNVIADTSEIEQLYEPHELQRQIIEFDEAWWQLNNAYKIANKNYVSSIVARLGNRLDVEMVSLDPSRDNSEFLASKRNLYPEMYYSGECHAEDWALPKEERRSREYRMQSCFYGHYWTYMSSLKMENADQVDFFHQYRIRYAEITKHLTQEQIDRFIREYEGNFDMRFVNGPMQSDHKMIQ